MYNIDNAKNNLEELSAFIRSQNRLPKKQRDYAKIQEVKARMKAIQSDMSAGVVTTAPAKKTMSKDEFSERFKDTFNVPEPVGIMKIETLEQLDLAWPNIKGKSISIDCSPDIQQEIVRRIKSEMSINIKVDGFKDVKLGR